MGHGYGGDIRRVHRGAWLMDRVVATGSVVMKTVGGNRAGAVAAHRFLSHADVSPEAILQEVVALTAQACKGMDVLAIQDTTEINFSGCDLGRVGLGPAGDGEALGFFVHPVVVVAQASGDVLGLADAAIWTRGPEKVADRKTRAFDDKEARRWLSGVEKSVACLGKARRVTVVGDRESDIYAVFACKPEGVDLLVRAAQNRTLAEGGLMFEAAGAFEAMVCTQVAITPRSPGEKPRTARLHVTAGPVSIARPTRYARYDRTGADWPATVRLNLVVAEETAAPAETAPQTSPSKPLPKPLPKPLHWRLLTTWPIATAEDVLAVIDAYRQRWRIEEVFRALKRDGLKLEETQVETAHRLFNLAAIALIAAVRIIQLTDARNGSQRLASDVLQSNGISAAIAIGKTLQGKTLRQQNPHPQHSLSHIAWITARLGGWDCYGKPPGPKTMAQGWRKLLIMITAFDIARSDANV